MVHARADQATYRDDRICQIEEGVDHVLAPPVASLQPAEGVMPGVGAFDWPALPARMGAFSLRRDLATAFRKLQPEVVITMSFNLS